MRVGGNWRRHVWCALIVLLACAATACGGGGGGGGGGAPAGGSGGPQPATPTPPAVFDGQRSIAVGRSLLSSLEEVSVIAGLADFVVLELAQSGRAVDLYCVQLDGTEVPIVFVHTDNDRDGAASPGDVIDFDIASCDGFRYDVTVTLPAGNLWTDRYDARIRFVDTFPTGATLNGSFDLQAPFLTSFNPVILMNGLTATFQQAGQSERITGAAAIEFGANQEFDIQFAGTVSSDRLNGIYTFSTVENLRGVLGGLPRLGVIRLVGANSAVEFRVTDDNARVGLLDLELDSNGDGVFDPAGTIEWAELIYGTFFGWLPHEPPRITSLAFDPAMPSVGDELIARYTAEDPEGGNVFFRFEWSINGTPLYGGGTQSDLVVLDPRNFANGDTITFRLAASDGDYFVEQAITTTVQNSAPVISGLRITPAMPRATQYLTAEFTTSDPDQDALTTTIQWYVNDQLLVHRLIRTLPPEEFSAGDVVRVVVSAADSEAVVTAAATVTIEDTPPQISFLNPPPGEIGYDEVYSASTEITDIDGDPVDDIEFRLAFGPSGMSVDPATGVVHWLDKGPMFRERVSFNYGVTLDAPGANILTSTVDVVDPDRERVLFRTTFDYGAPDDDGLLAWDLDGDEADEMLIGGSYVLEFSEGAYRRTWQNPGIDQDRMAFSTFGAGDLDGDGRAEIIGTYGDRAGVLDGVKRRLINDVLLDDDWASNFQKSMVADLNGDGRLEFITSNLTRLRILNAASLSTIWELPEGLYGWDMTIGNVDADPALEIVFSSGWVIDGVTFVLERDFGTPGERNVAVGDLDGDGIGEIAIADSNPAVIRGFSALSGNEIWTIPNASTGTLRIADVGGGAEGELIVGDGEISPAFLSIYRDDGGPAPALIAQMAAYTDDGINAIATGDFDDDGELEIAFSEMGPPQTITVASSDLATVEWTTASLTTPRSGPMSRGARMARSSVASPKLINIVRFPTAGLRLLGMDPDTGAIEYSGVIGDATSNSIAITVADYDNDLTDEILVLVTEDLQATVMAIDYFTGAVEWESPPLPRGGSPDAIAHGDLTGDGRGDVVAIHNNTAYAFDIHASQQIWTIPIAFSHDQTVEVADVNGRGSAEIVMSSGHSIAVYSGDDGPISLVTTANLGARDIAVGDVDGDGEPEIFALMGRHASNNADIYRLNEELELQSIGELSRPAEGIAIEKSDHDRVNLIVWHDQDPGLVVVDPDDGSEIWTWPFYFGRVADANAVQYEEIGGDYRIVMTTTSGVYITQ